MKQRECTVCKNTYPLNNFYKNKFGKFKRQARCKPCNKFYDYKIDKNSKLKKAYGITLNQYNDMLSKQNGKCMICLVDNNGFYNNKQKAFAVDHCHTTGKIRGLLCNDCNVGIGLLKDNIDLLNNAIKYLNKSRN